MMSLHSLFGRHCADLEASHREQCGFASRCTICALAMIKLPGLAWQLRPSEA